MKIQIYSDLHLENFNGIPLLTPRCKYLFLTGDIGKIKNNNFKLFFDYVSSNWEKVFYILGNHEYYYPKHDYKTTKELYNDFFKDYSNVFLLDKTKVVLEDEETNESYDILGCTLWSKTNELITNYVNCFTQIKEKNEKGWNVYLSCDTYNNWNKEDTEWLKKNYNNENNTIILTHYPTSQYNTSSPIYNNQNPELKALFANDILFVPKNKKLICISGHTHYSYDFTTKNTRYISNQMGYKEELINSSTNFNFDGVYII